MDELTADSALSRAHGAALLRQVGGPLEFTGPSAADSTADAPVDVLSPRGPLRGVRVAEIEAGTWTWLTALTERGPEPASDELLRLASALHQGAPVVLAPRDQGPAMVVALMVEDSAAALPEVSLRQVLVEGLRDTPDESRAALRSFASKHGIDLREEENHLWLGSQRVDMQGDMALQVPAEGSPTLADIFADSFYLSTEHQLFFEGRFPEHQRPRLDLGTSTAHGMEALVLGTFSRDFFTWAWADPGFPAIAQTPSRHLYAFGLTHGILPFLRPRLPLEQATRWDVAVLAKPILGAWTHAVAPLTPERHALILLRSPSLHLPPLNHEVSQRVLAEPLPRGIDEQRARAAYTRARKA